MVSGADQVCETPAGPSAAGRLRARLLGPGQSDFGRILGYTLGQAAKAVGMSKTSILRSIKAGRISAGRDEFGQWAIESCELRRVYPALTEDTVTGNGTGERAVTGGETALAEVSTR
jgi:hypothetical protein